MLRPFTVLEGRSVVRSGAVVVHSRASRSEIGTEPTSRSLPLREFVVEAARPWGVAHIRPESRIGRAPGGELRGAPRRPTWATGRRPHLSTRRCHGGRQGELGAGTITCNYDGTHKFPTHIGERAFIGQQLDPGGDRDIGEGGSSARAARSRKTCRRGARPGSQPSVTKPGWGGGPCGRETKGLIGHVRDRGLRGFAGCGARDIVEGYGGSSIAGTTRPEWP